MTEQQPYQKTIPFEAKDLVDLLGKDLVLTVYRTAHQGVEGMLSQTAYTKGWITARYNLGYLSAVRAESGERFPTQPIKEAREEYIFRPHKAEFSDTTPPILKGNVLHLNKYVAVYFKEIPKQKTLQEIGVL